MRRSVPSIGNPAIHANHCEAIAAAVPYEPRYKQVEQAAEQRTRSEGNNKVLPTMRFRRSRFGRRHNTAIRRYCNLRNEAVSPSREGFNVARRLGIVVKHLAQLLDVGIQAVFEIYECIFWPDVLAQFFAVTSSPGRSRRSARTAMGWPCSLSLMPFLYSSAVWRSSSNAPKRIFCCAVGTGTLHPTIAATPAHDPPMGKSSTSRER